MGMSNDWPVSISLLPPPLLSPPPFLSHSDNGFARVVTGVRRARVREGAVGRVGLRS